MKGLLVLAIFVLAVVENVVVAQKNCYVCGWIEGAGQADVCSDSNFDSSAPTVAQISCADSYCYTYVTEKTDILPASVVRSCDAAATPGVPSFCAEAGTGPGPGGIGEVTCCNDNLCNAPGGGGGGGGGGGAAGIVIDLSVIITSTVVTIWTARQF
ncbi:uncharacterized protein [Amphiura filiformis]|uniref:uncharacterized protein n=1 Tax=Amphiura filiformis TaxID=82378 RepID=UPI003B212BE6